MSIPLLDLTPEIRVVGTAHVSKKSIELVQDQISEFKPDLVAVELCSSRLSSLQNPRLWMMKTCYRSLRTEGLE